MIFLKLIQKITCGHFVENLNENFFRCRGGKFHGWGNIVRLSNIAQYLFEKNKEIFFIYEGDDFVKNYLEQF